MQYNNELVKVTSPVLATTEGVTHNYGSSMLLYVPCEKAMLYL